MTDDNLRQRRGKKRECCCGCCPPNTLIDMSLNNDSASGCLMKCLQCDLVLNSRVIKEYQVLNIAPVYKTATHAKALKCTITYRQVGAGESTE